MTPTYSILPLDCRLAMRLTMAPDSVDSIVTDPPYDLTSIVKRFGGANAAPAQHGTDGAFARASRGFMGQQWDGTGVAFDPATWTEAYRVLKPGDHLIAFGGSRTYHRLACAIEDAGFEIRDQIMWLYGSGFPKSHDISKAIDKMAGAEREVVGRYETGRRATPKQDFRGGAHHACGGNGDIDLSAITAPATREALAWNGWGTALKPAHEPIVLARKPIAAGSVAANVLTHGTGGINIDGCRVEASDPDAYQANCSGDRGHADNRSRDMDFAMGAGRSNSAGRFPANVMHDGSDEVLAGFPSPHGAGHARAAIREADGAGIFGIAGGDGHRFGDSGSAARFFANFQMDDIEWLDQSLQLDSANIADGRLSLQSLFAAFARGPAAVWACPGAKVSLDIQIPPSMSATLNESRQIVETLIGAIQHTVSAFWQESPPEKLSLSLNNVQFVAEAGPTGIILTIPALSILSGFVGVVIFSITPTNWEAGAKDSGQFTDSFKYCAKASKADREEGLDGFALQVADTAHKIPRSEINDPRRAGTVPRANHHPTVKPTALMRYLCRLVTPPGGTVLDPFAGSGSTGKAALLEGFSFIGCEMTAEYVPIAEARLAHALAQWSATL